MPLASRPPPPARPGQRTTRSPAPVAPGERVARAQNAPGFAENDLHSDTAFSLAAARPPPPRPSRPAHAGLPRLPRPSPVSADAGRGWAKSSHAPWPSVWARPRRARRGNTAGGPSVTDGRIVSAGRSAVRLSRGSSPFAETREPVRGNSPPAVAARVPGSRPPIAADVGGLEPSAPRVASDGQTLSHGQSSHLFVPSALWES